MPSGFGEPSGNDAKRSTRPRSHAAASSGISAKQASRNKAAREIADISPPGRSLARPVCPSNAAASRRRSQKKNARLRKKSGVRAVTFYSGLACGSVVAIVVIAVVVMMIVVMIQFFAQFLGGAVVRIAWQKNRACGGGLRDQAIRVLLQQEALADFFLGDVRHQAVVALLAALALFDRAARIAAPQPRSLGHGERNVAGGQIAFVALQRPARDRVPAGIGPQGGLQQH